MEEYSDTNFPSLDEVTTTLLDLDTPLQKSSLTILSDLVGDDFFNFKQVWPNIPINRRLGILEKLEQMYDKDTLLSFETIGRLALEDSDFQIRFTSLRFLQGYEVKDLIQTFLELLEEDENEDIRAVAATTLGKYVYLGEINKLSRSKFESIENCLIRVIERDASNQVRRRALESLGYSSNEEVPKLIRKAFDSENEPWIVSAFIAMGRSLDNRWDPEIIKMLDHDSPEIIIEASKAAGELEISEAKIKLLDHLLDENPEIRMAAVWSLSKLGGEGLQVIFENLIEETDLEDEINLIKDALDNLIFNQSIGLFDDIDFENPADYLLGGEEKEK
jgi:HEAT repeat protein